MNQKKIIGVLGGYGPKATAEFFSLLINEKQVEKDWENLHIILDNNPRIPSRARAYLFDETSPIELMFEGIERLKKSGADFFVCPCNSAHYFLRKEKEKLPLPMLDMVEVMAELIKEKKLKKIGLIGSEVTALSKMYDSELEKINCEVIHVDNLENVRFVIETGKTGLNLPKGKQVLEELIEELKNKGAELILFACTELSLVIPVEAYFKGFILDTNTALAQYTVEYSLQ